MGSQENGQSPLPNACWNAEKELIWQMVPSCVHGPHKGTAGLGSSLQPFQHNPLFFCKVRIGQWQQNWCCSLMLHSVVFLTTYSLAARTGINLFSTTSKLLITEFCELFACDKKKHEKSKHGSTREHPGRGHATMGMCSLQWQLQPAPVSETCMHPDVPVPAQNISTAWKHHEGFPVPQLPPRWEEDIQRCS